MSNGIATEESDLLAKPRFPLIDGLARMDMAP